MLELQAYYSKCSLIQKKWQFIKTQTLLDKKAN